MSDEQIKELRSTANAHCVDRAIDFAENYNPRNVVVYLPHSQLHSNAVSLSRLKTIKLWQQSHFFVFAPVSKNS